MPDAQPFAIEDVVDPTPFLPRPGIPAWLWFTAAIVVWVAAILLIRALRRRRSSPPDPRQLRETARRSAVAALDATDRSLPPHALATAVSLILRRFLADACNDPALFETHEQFLARGELPATLPPELRQALAGTFATLARMKYAHDAPAPAEDLVALVRPLIDRIHAALSA